MAPLGTGQEAQGELTHTTEPMTMRRLTRWLTPVAVLLLCAASAAADEPEPKPERVPVLGYFLAFLFTVLTMVIVCMPSRKQ